MNLILDVLRDPIWQFIGVVIPVLSAVVIYGYRKLRSRKNQPSADSSSSTGKPIVRKLKPVEEIVLVLYIILSTLFSQVLIVRVFDTNIPFGNSTGNFPLFLAILLVVGLITFAVLLLDYVLAVYIHLHFFASCVIAALLLMAWGGGSPIIDWTHLIDFEVRNILEAREIFLSTYILTVFPFAVIYFHDRKIEQNKLHAQQKDSKVTLTNRKREQ